MTKKIDVLDHIYDPDTYLDGAFDPVDDAPDLSRGIWAAKMEAAIAARGRPPSERPKVQTTLRLDPDILSTFKAGGPGWQSRMNAALRKAAGLPD
jgi:uncharacterized protein (DUF4415 family)